MMRLYWKKTFQGLIDDIRSMSESGYITWNNLMSNLPKYPEYNATLWRLEIFRQEGVYDPKRQTFHGTVDAFYQLGELNRKQPKDISSLVSDRKEMIIFRIDTEKLDDFQRFLDGCTDALTLDLQPIPQSE